MRLALEKKYSSILCISDQHFPYNHPDVVAFLLAIKKKYKPDCVVNIGDEIDGHSISFHDADPDLLSPSGELQTAIDRLQPIYKMLPDMWLIESNHGSLVYRKAKTHGIPSRALKSYREVLEAPQGWRWTPDLTLRMSNGEYVYFCHGKSTDVLRVSQAMGISAVQGHFHEKFELRFWGNSRGLYFGMTIGCLIDNKSLAFAYNKINLKRPVIGTAVIIDGIPHLVPMVLNGNGRWVKKLP